MTDISATGTTWTLPRINLEREAEPQEVFPNLLSEFIYKRTYSRWVTEKGRRETWPETVQRYMDFVTEERDIPRHVSKEIQAAILQMEVLPSMRALWAAGEAAKRDNTCMYNCSFLPMDSLKSFSELLYILMQGTGVGFSVESRFVEALPVVGETSNTTIHHTIADSTEGWADALWFGVQQWWKGYKVEFDYSGIRPAGSPLKIKGGRASGPEPLRKLMDFAETTVLAGGGRKLRPLEVHDICCQIAEIVMVGGFRRAALISFSDPENEEIRHAKDWTRGDFPAIRYMSNNTAVYEGKPSEALFEAEWRSLVNSKSGERGFFSYPQWRREQRGGECRANPCGEILLRFDTANDAITGEGGSGSFCNLTSAVMRSHDTRETMAKKVRLATWVGALQSTFTHFPYLRPGWAQVCEQDRLLGVDITGQCDNPKLSTDPEVMLYLNSVARDTAAEATAYLGINMPVAITCGKPSGNSSQLVDCASGFHPRFSPYYFRHVRIAASDPLFRMVRDAGVPAFPENGQEHMAKEDVNVWVVRFPVKAPENAIFRHHETAIEQCDRYLHIMETWCGERGHNQSATIYVREHEWEGIGQWVWENFDRLTGLTFLPFDGGKYRLPPYQEIDQAEYEKAQALMPKVDFSYLSTYEREDRGEGAQELACRGGSCEL